MVVCRRSQGVELKDLERSPVLVGDRVVIETNDGIKRGTVTEARSKVALVETSEGQIRTVTQDRMLKHE